ncbi:Uncharacterized protein Fot_31509 [Forsythia ovata]|uniref:Uncharacterized protein n=1 Tax=Forsythia ovata TaxID=205694 RepID=A0ABD1T589_9LAMI
MEENNNCNMVPASDSSIKSLETKRLDDKNNGVDEICMICLDEYSHELEVTFLYKLVESSAEDFFDSEIERNTVTAETINIDNTSTSSTAHRPPHDRTRTKEAFVGPSADVVSSLNSGDNNIMQSNV